jgi:fumarate reductase flavoprotein subunit
MTVLDSDRDFEFRIPVAIVGAGACGLTAAIAARDAGADVLVFERDRRARGSTSMSLGAMCAAGTAEQRRHGIEDGAEAFVADVMAKTEGRGDARLARVIGAESGPTLDWLTGAHDVPLGLDFAWTGLGHSVPRLHLPPGRNGEELMALLGAAAARAGAEVLTDARVVALYATPAGCVDGLRLERPDGSTEDIGCDALVLATCGFGGNHAMIAQHIPAMAGARYFGHEGNQGDGIRWGVELGAAVADMSAYQGLGTLAEPQAIVVPHPLLIEGGVLVNARGERFTHELENISGMCVPVLAQPDRIAWVVFDERRHQSVLAHSHEQRQLVEVGAIRRAGSVAELELACSVPPGSLARTLADVEAARAGRRADGFGRRFDGLAPLDAPFCALRVTGALFHTQGGLVVDASARVTRVDGSLLPNVFAGGGAARSISGPDVRGYLPGAGLCMAVTLGRIAGRAAARLSVERPPTSSLP